MNRWLDIFAKKKYVENHPRLTRKLASISAGTLITSDTAMEVSAFHRGVTYISTQIAKLPWEVKNSKNELMVDNQITKLINLAPNPEVNAFNFRLMLIQQAIISGNAYAEIERDMRGRVKHLWPMWHLDVCPIRDSKNKLWYRIVGGRVDGSDAFLDPKDVYHVRNFHTKDGISGLGLIDYASETLGIAKGSDKYANSLFANGGMPSGVLETEKQLSAEAIERIAESWSSKYGNRKTGSTAILEDGLKYSPISHDPQVLQFLESRQFSVVEIARFLGVPPTKLFDTQAATFNNIENANLEVATDTLDAWARNLEIEADVKLLSNSFGGLKTEFNMHQVFRGDMKTRGNYFKDLMATGSISPNEIREMEGKSKYKDGDRYFIPTNNLTPTDRLDEVIDSQTREKETVTPLEKEAVNYLKRN